MKTFIQSIFAASSLITMSMSACDLANAIDIIFIVDSSGSVYDEGYNNWQSELDLVASVVQLLPDNARAGMIKLAGCGGSTTLQQCMEQGRLETMIGLDQFEPSYMGTPIGTRPPHLTEFYDEVRSFGAADFTGGYTWTDAALTLALNEFKSKPRQNHVVPNQVIVLITDGQPYPVSWAACDAQTGYVSDTLGQLRDDLGVVMINVGIDISPEAKDEFFACMTQDTDKYFFDGLFDTLPRFADEIGELICEEAQIETECEDLQNMVYTECGSCDKTCENPNTICMAVCQKKCECRSPNSIYDEGQCIPLSLC